MESKQLKIPMSDRVRNTLDEVGGEPLAGSGFEDETPDPGFSEIEIQTRKAGEFVIGDGFLRRLFQD
jgi:hypothetical protein